jgi:hypothetical protein
MTNKNHESAEAEATERDAKGRFLSGNKGGGRSKGARSRLGEAFIEALAADFNEHGVATIEKVRTRDPTAYVKVISNILPREVLTAAFNVTSININDMAETEGFLAAPIALRATGSMPFPWSR